MHIKELEFYGLPGFPDDTKYILTRKINILHGQNREKQTKILQAIQFIMNPLLENLSIYPEHQSIVRDDAFIEILVEKDQKNYNLRRNLKDPTLVYINRKPASIEDVYKIITYTSISPQISLLDGELVGAMMQYTEKNWLEWLKMHLDVVESLDMEFGGVLDACETLKRHTWSVLVDTAEKIKHFSECVAIEKKVGALKAVKAERDHRSVDLTMQKVKKEIFLLLREIRRQDSEFLHIQLGKYEVENEIIYTQAMKHMTELYQHLCKDFTDPEVVSEGEIDELKILLSDLIGTTRESVEKILCDHVAPNKDSPKYRKDFLKMCLQLAQILKVAPSDHGFEEYGETFEFLQNSKLELENDLNKLKTKLSAIWTNVQDSYSTCAAHIEAFAENQKDFLDNVVSINVKLNKFYTLHLQMMGIILMEDRWTNRMVDLGILLQIEPEILAGVNYIEYTVAALAADNKLPFKIDNYHGPLFRYLCFTKETSPSVVHKFMHILKPLYTIILVETKADAQKLLALASEYLQMGKMMLNILPLELFDSDKKFTEDIFDGLPVAEAIYENLCENKFTHENDIFRRELFKNMLKRIVFSEMTECPEGLVVVNKEGDFVANGAIGGGSYCWEMNDVPKYLRMYCSIGVKCEDLKRERAKILVEMDACGVDDDRKQLCEKERMTFGIDLVREISKHLCDLRHKMKDIYLGRRCLQKVIDDMAIIQDALKLVEDDALQSKEFYENELNMLVGNIERDASTDEELNNQIRKLHSDVNQLDHLANVMDWKYAWFDGGVTFKCSLDKTESGLSSDLGHYDDKIDTWLSELEKMDEQCDEMRMARGDQEMLKDSLNSQFLTYKEILDKSTKSMAQHVVVPMRDKVAFANLSMVEINENLSQEMEKFTQLTGHRHVHKINDVVKMKLSRWNNRLKNLTGKLELMSTTEHNEALIWSDHTFAVQQLRAFLDILREVHFSRPNGKSFHFSFLLKKSTGHWLDCNRGISSKITSLSDICGIKWIIVGEGDTVTEFDDVSPKDLCLCILAANYAMGVLNNVSTFLMDLNGIKKSSSHLSEEDITSLFYSLINDHQVITISQQPIINDLFRNISVE